MARILYCPSGWGVQVYSNGAASPQFPQCTGPYGIQPNVAWDTYRRTDSSCNIPASTRRFHCDFQGYADDESWTCDCTPRTLSPSAPPTVATTTRITTVTTHTMMAANNRSIRTLQAENNNQSAQIAYLTSQVNTLSTQLALLQQTTAAVSVQGAIHNATFALVTSAIGAALQVLPDMPPPQAPPPPCFGTACNPAIRTGENNSLLLKAQSRVLVQTSECSVNPCELRDQVRGIIQAISYLNP